MNNVKEIKKIDIHAHATAFPEFFPPCVAGGRFVSAEEVIAFYDKLGIEKGVLLPISSPEGQVTPMTTEACKMLSDKYPDRFMWFCNVDPRAGSNDEHANLTEILAFYKESGAKGVGEITANIYFDDKRADNLFSSCEELELPVLFHIAPEFRYYGLVDELGLPRLEKMLKAHPKLKFIGHSQPFWAEMSADVNEQNRGHYPEGRVKDGRIAGLLREYGNLYCDHSAGSGANALMRDPDYAARFIEEFSDRLLYGCDICRNDNTHPFGFKDFLENMLENGAVSEQNYIKLIRGNAEKLLGL